MRILLGTNIHVRISDTLDPQYTPATQSLTKLHRRGERLCIVPQNLVEFRNVATRPRRLNGLEMTPADAQRQSDLFEESFSILPETPDIHPTWKAIVAALGVIGKQVHDARLVATCLVNDVKGVLTFNESHFERFADYGVGLLVLHPSRV